MATEPEDGYIIKVDRREQKPWEFTKRRPCLGSEPATLKTGDYTLAGFEDVVAVERKRSTGEIATNVFQDRFERELERLDLFPLPFLVCEFTLADVLAFPQGSGIPRSRWRRLRTKPGTLLKRLNEIQVRHKTRLIFAGEHGREFVASLFKRVWEGRRDGRW